MRPRILCVVALLLLVPLLASAQLTPQERQQAETLIGQFAAREFTVRQKAVEALIAMGIDVLPLVKETLTRTKDNEVKLRCRMVIDRLAEAVREAERLVEKRIRDLGPPPPEQCRKIETSVHGDGVFYIEMRGDRERVLHNGVAGPDYERIEGIRISPDGRRVAYVARVPEQRSVYTLVCDGVESARFPRVGAPRFSPDSRRMAYGVKRPDGWFVQCDGRSWGPYKAYVHLEFTPEGGGLLGVVLAGDKSFVVVDGIAGPSHDRVWDPVSFAGPGARPRYIAADKDEVRLVELEWPPAELSDEQKRAAADLIRQLSADEFAVRERATGVLVEIGPGVLALLRQTLARTDDPEVKLRCHQAIRNIRLVEKTVRKLPKPPAHFLDSVPVLLSPNGQNLAYRTQADGKVRFIFNGIEHKGYAKILLSPLLSPDGRHMAYIVEDGAKQFVVLDGKEGIRYDKVNGWGMTFSPDGSHLAYAAQRGKEWFAVLDGRELHAYRRVSQLQFSPDGKHLCYMARRDAGRMIVCDDREGPAYAWVHMPRFSPDSRHLYYLATREDSQFIVCDGREGPPRHRGSLKNWQMVEQRSEGELRYLVVDKGRVSLVEVNWPKDRDWTSGLKPIEPEEEKP